MSDRKNDASLGAMVAQPTSAVFDRQVEDFRLPAEHSRGGCATSPSPGGRGNEASAISRRTAMQWVMAVAAASSLPRGSFGQSAASPAKAAKGYGVDANLVKVYQPGAFWPLTFTPAQRRIASVLADAIIPKDELGPAASEVGVPAFIDEWISAPYPDQQRDRPIILEGIAWVESESHSRFKRGFAELSGEQHRAICDEICFIETAGPRLRKPALFFSRFRWLTAAAYYATPEGWKAIGYVGNVILQQFDGPPPDVLVKLGVTQTVS